MSEEIIKVLDNLAQKFGIAIDWTSQNVMPYLEDLASRYIAYNNLIAITQIVISVILIATGIICTIKLIRWTKKDTFDTYNDDEFIFITGMTGSLILIALGVVLIIGNTIGIIQNVCMPELTILDYIKTLT